jgi:riboflavin biosynthesis pyrimidine reductase
MRPRVVLNMVMSLDGRTTIGGKVGNLTGPADQERLIRLRRENDAVLVGAGTARNEHYAQLLPPGENQPLVVIVSASGNVTSDTVPLLAEPDARVMIVGGDLHAVLESLTTEYGVESVVCEGGPMLNDTLIAAGLVDELYLTMSPKLIDGNERTLADNRHPHAPFDARLLSADQDGDFVFLHYEL